ncbi:hypothetical protein HanHA300_Chr17g0667321 [Helianthus annuus]|nr:hypothetical protein HanHA300_Chr17g0667321 [Helianthus annuus]
MTRPDPTRLPGLLNTFFPNNSDVINCDSKVKTLPKQILAKCQQQEAIVNHEDYKTTRRCVKFYTIKQSCTFH